VYDDTLTVGFKCRAFVSVGQNPDVKKVLKDVLLELDKEKFRDIHSLTRDVKQLIDLLREFLGNKRYESPTQCTLFGWLVSQLASSAFLSYQIRISHQPIILFSHNKLGQATSHRQPNRVLYTEM